MNNTEEQHVVERQTLFDFDKSQTLPVVDMAVDIDVDIGVGIGVGSAV